MSITEMKDAQPLSLRGVTKRFGAVAALHNVSFEVAAGEVICLLGPSGCGKSTLLRVIGGVERADAGELHLGRTPVFGPGCFVEPERRNIGFMFQDYALFPHLTVLRNVSFGLRGMGRAVAEARAAEVLAVAGVEHLSGRYPHMLSGGEQQRVALARALAPRPAVLLMDEPFSNLDQGLRDSVREDTLRLLRDFGTTTIIVTHDPQEALATGDRLVLMRDGCVVADGAPRQLYEDPPHLYAAQFLGPGNALAAQVRSGAVETPLGRFACPNLADGQAVFAFFRPRALRLAPAGEGANAEVLTSAFQGEQERLSLKLAGCPDPLQLRVAAGSAPRPGTRVGLQVDPAAIRIFADEGSGKF